MIDLQKVNKLYHGKSVVKDVQLTIPEKKLTAFIGPNGAGKSTVLSMISRLIPKDTGDFRLVDKKVVEVINSLPEHNKFLRGLFSWVGFEQKEYFQATQESKEVPNVQF